MEPFIGEIRAFGFDYTPRGWLPCQGQVVSINTYSTLFALLGDRYGGDGRSTFGIPDLRGRVPMGYGTGIGLTPKYMGQMLGVEAVTLTQNEMPVHTHTGSGEVKASNEEATSTEPESKFLCKPSETNIYGDGRTSKAMADDTIHIDISNTGGGQAHYNLQPSLVLNYCIAVEGYWPPRQ